MPVIVGSADVKASYPSLDIDFTIEKVCEVFMNSGICIDNVDVEGLYLALNRTSSELEDHNLTAVCPSRKHPSGRLPAITASGTASKKEDRFLPWDKARWEPTNREKRFMLVEGLGIALKEVMYNRVYTFDGVVRKQRNGDPIGLQLTGNIAQVFYDVVGG